MINMKHIKYSVILSVLFLVGCTENQRARRYGGTYNETLPPGQKLVNATWKEHSLWILTKPMSSNDTAETYSFSEKSSFGIVEGKVIIQESK